MTPTSIQLCKLKTKVLYLALLLFCYPQQLYHQHLLIGALYPRWTSTIYSPYCRQRDLCTQQIWSCLSPVLPPKHTKTSQWFSLLLEKKTKTNKRWPKRPLTSPGGLVVKIWHSHRSSPGLLPSQETTSPVCLLSCLSSSMLLWCWKLCHQYFKYHEGPPWWTDFSGASRLRQTRKRTWPPTSKNIGHENPMNSSRALFDTVPEDERMAQEDCTGFCSAVHRVN